MAKKNNHLDQVLAQAAQSYRAGNRTAAIRLYEQAVAKAPRHATAHNFLGLAYAQQGELERAVPVLEKAIALDPNLPSCRYNLGTILQQLKRYDDAREQYELAIAQQPGDPELHSNLGVVLRALGQTDQAIEHFGRAIKLNPRFVAAHFNLGNALQELRRREEAYAAFAAVLALEPNFADAHTNAAYALAALKRYSEALVHFDKAISLKADFPKIHVDRGKVLFHLYRPAEAVASYERALLLQPNLPEANLDCAAALNRLDRFEEAIACCQRVLSHDHANITAKSHLASSLWGLRKYDEALTLVQQVLAQDPELGAAHCTLATVLEALGRDDEALQSYDTALKYVPDDKICELNKGLCHFSLGQLADGWPLFEYRWYGRAAPPSYPQPSWNGEPLNGPLLVWAEQGLGDQILFSSMIKDVRARVPSLRFEVESRLVPLFARSFPDIDVIPIGRDLSGGGSIAAQIALGSIGRHVRPDWNAFKIPPPAYLMADPVRVAGLRARLTSQGKCVIGLSWSSANPKVGQAKTAKLLDFASVLRIPGCRFVDLQYGDTHAERAAVLDELGIDVERQEDIDNLNDIDGLAALISACDVVVTTSSTTAHLAGALGKPTWVLLPFGRGRMWYWFWKREDSPWYPGARLKRQIKDQSWSRLISLSTPEIAAAATQR